MTKSQGICQDLANMNTNHILLSSREDMISASKVNPNMMTTRFLDQVHMSIRVRYSSMDPSKSPATALAQG